LKQIFQGRILFLGCGSIARCTLPLLLKHIEMPANHFIIIDAIDHRDKITDLLARGILYAQIKITPENLSTVLEQYLQAGDIVIDLACSIDTIAILSWCNQHDVMYLNTSVEIWDPYSTMKNTHPRERTLYARHMNLRHSVSETHKKQGATAVLEHGANPGLISHFAKMGLIDLASALIHQSTDKRYQASLEKAISEENFPLLGYLTETKVIHVSERDSQIVNKPKKVNEFVNTWSVEGLYEEGIAPAELGWGTHEKQFPQDAFDYPTGPNHQICLAKMGMHTRVHSWVPSGEIIGMLVRHGEAFSLSEFLSLYEQDKLIYRPTVHYAYCPSDGAIASLHELSMRHYQLQADLRILQDEIIDGVDELGALLLGNTQHGWWTGTVLDIHSARELIQGQSATTVQVAAGVMSALMWMIQNPWKGVNLPETLPFKAIIEYAKPYLGQILSIPTDWHPQKNKPNYFKVYRQGEALIDDYQFQGFLAD
jgi:homospermidine synthase